MPKPSATLIDTSAKCHDVVVNQRRVTLNLDEDVVEALQALDARNLSAAANDALRQAVADHAHRRALLAWLDELDAKYGTATPEERTAARAFVDALERGEEPGSSAA
ncbi:MAG TPA: type II toxin-antitoxin system CcdA family antitoxin [Pseudonocardiaceae bacterium]|nr:type II toxin-antitoxin system CcdA family antitoxin [Pseudonocardiaceae bacterium]